MVLPLLHLTIHNAKKVTFDGRDCFVLSLNNERGTLLFYPATGRYDPDATSEHTTLVEAINKANEVAQRRGITKLYIVQEGGGLTQLPLSPKEVPNAT